jgi:hypothetical protein
VGRGVTAAACRSRAIDSPHHVIRALLADDDRWRPGGDDRAIADPLPGQASTATPTARPMTVGEACDA